MRGRKKTSNHRRIKRRTIRSRKHQTRRKTSKKRGGGYGTYADYLDFMKDDDPNAVPMSKEQWQKNFDKEHKDDLPYNPYI